MDDDGWMDTADLKKKLSTTPGATCRRTENRKI